MWGMPITYITHILWWLYICIYATIQHYIMGQFVTVAVYDKKPLPKTTSHIIHVSLMDSSTNNVAIALFSAFVKIFGHVVALQRAYACECNIRCKLTAVPAWRHA